MRRLNHALMPALVVTMLVCAGAVPAAAAGHWKCEAGNWIAVGQPQHPMPLKKCGSELTIPREQVACESAGGRWGPAGIFPQPICRVPTHDVGRACADDGECEGRCLAAPTPAQRDQLRNRQKLPMLGKCTPYVPVFGCMAVVQEGFVTGLLCAD